MKYLGAFQLFLCAGTLFPLASQAQQTMNIEICYMVQGGAGGHSHRPTTSEIASVVQMFACHGRTLNIVISNSIPEVAVMPLNPNNSNDFFDFNNGSTSFAYLKSIYFIHANDAGWHHCIFGHQYADPNGSASGSSGLAERPGDDLVVTLGSFAGQIGTPFDRAATLAHEFGHNLGLVHAPYGPFQPNKPSTMSYFYQLSGVRTQLTSSGLSSAAALFKEMDYSEGTMCTLNQTALNETLGTRMSSVDWNCNGSIGGVVTTVIDAAASWCPAVSGTLFTLPDVNEWAVIHDPTQGLAPEELIQAPISKCITAVEAELVAIASPTVQPVPTNEPCVQGRMIYVEPIGFPNPNGNCAAPYNTPGQAQPAIPDSSYLFLSPGSYHEGGQVTYRKPMTIFSNVGIATVSP